MTTEPEPMQAGVVNVLLTIDPVASHAAGAYLTWDGAAFDEEQTARCDAATPHELWAWTVTTDVTPGAAAGTRADLRRLTTIVAGAAGQAPDAFHEAVLAHFAGCSARDVLGPGSGDSAAATDSAAAGEYRPHPVVFGETVLPQIFRDTVLPSLAGQDRDEAVALLGRLEPAGGPPDAGAAR